MEPEPATGGANGGARGPPGGGSGLGGAVGAWSGERNLPAGPPEGRGGWAEAAARAALAGGPPEGAEGSLDPRAGAAAFAAAGGALGRAGALRARVLALAKGLGGGPCASGDLTLLRLIADGGPGACGAASELEDALGWALPELAAAAALAPDPAVRALLRRILVARPPGVLHGLPPGLRRHALSRLVAAVLQAGRGVFKAQGEAGSVLLREAADARGALLAALRGEVAAVAVAFDLALAEAAEAAWAAAAAEGGAGWRLLSGLRPLLCPSASAAAAASAQEGALRHTDVAASLAAVNWGGAADELARTPLPPLAAGGAPGGPGPRAHLPSPPSGRKRGRGEGGGGPGSKGDGDIPRGVAFALLWGVLGEALRSLDARGVEDVCRGAADGLAALAAASLEPPPSVTAYAAALPAYTPSPYDRAVTALSDFGAAGGTSYPLEATMELVAGHCPGALHCCGDVWRALLAARAARCCPRVSCRPGYAAGGEPRAAAARLARVFLAAGWLQGPVGAAAGVLALVPEADAADILRMVWDQLPSRESGGAEEGGASSPLARPGTAGDGAARRGLLAIAHRNLEALAPHYARLTAQPSGEELQA